VKSGDLVKHKRLRRPHRAGFRVDLVGIIVSDDPIGDGNRLGVKKVYWFNKGTKPASVVANEELLLYGADSDPG